MSYLKEKQIALSITTICTLNCKNCAQLTSYLKEKNLQKMTPLDQVKKEFDSVFKIFDYIEDVTISGGEPLTHPNISEVVDYAMNFENQFDNLRIFSNETIIPSKKLIEQIKNYKKLNFVVDDYGPEVSKKVAEIKKIFENENLPLRVNNYHEKGNMYLNGWVDYGDPKKFRNYSDEELENNYKNCHVAHYKCIDVYDGYMLNCGWTLFGILADVFPKNYPVPEKYSESQIINILDEKISLEKKREIASNWGKKPFWQCQFCNSFNVKNSKRIPGGEQI